MAIIVGSWQFNIILVLTIFILLLKFIVVVYLSRQINEIKKQDEKMGLSFLNGIRVLMFMFLISRIFFMIFDFYLTQFNLNLYTISPKYWFWKLGGFFSGLGIAYLMWVSEKKVLQNKYKGFMTYFILFGCILVLVWPINDLDDFKFNSLILAITQLTILFFVVIFFNTFRKTSGEMKKIAWIMIVAITFYGVGSILVISNIIDYTNAKFGVNMDVYFYLIRAILKSIAIVLFAYVAKRFRM